MPGYISAEEVKKMRRQMRRPQHSYQLRYRPFTIQPFMIAPVLAGETLKHGMLQARTVTDPIKNPLIGWWQEHWFFYVKLRDLYDRDLLTQMIMDPTADVSSLDSATKLEHYHENTSSGSDIDYVKLCLERVVDEFFRYEGESSTTSGTVITGVAGGTMPVCQLPVQSFMDSAINDADYITAPDEDLTDVGSEGGAAVTISEIQNAAIRWEMARSAGLTQQTFEEYMASYTGDNAPQEKLFTPELIRYVRDWTYPTNTIDPSNGTPRSACSWVSESPINKARYFKEHGFIFGVTTARPKVYLSGLSSNAVMLMKDQKTWLPPSLMKDPHASMTKVAAGDAPLTGNTDAYWVDINDILQHGDQFINFALSATDANLFANPVAGGTQVGKRYPTSASIDALFVSASPANQVRSDGIVTLQIASRRHEDTSPNTLGVDTTV